MAGGMRRGGPRRRLVALATALVGAGLAAGCAPRLAPPLGDAAGAGGGTATRLGERLNPRIGEGVVRPERASAASRLDPHGGRVPPASADDDAPAAARPAP